MSAAREELVGRLVAGKYVLDSFVGRGAMGDVWRARQTALAKVVALKILHPELTIYEELTARFHREALAASRLDHPGVIRVLDFGEEPDGMLFIAMEYVDGADLQRLVARAWPLDARRVADILSQALAAVAAAHAQGVLHRDLKPENILVQAASDDDGRPVDVVKVCDFGIAKIVEPRSEGGGAGGAGGPGTPAPAPITATGLAVGTPEYMSPEQARGTPVDARSDVYSLGVVLYYLLTRTLPFQAETAVGVAVKHLFEEAPRPSARVPGVSPALEAVCLRAMRKKPEERYPSARAMRADIQAFAMGDSPGAAAPASGPAAPEAPASGGGPQPREAEVPAAGDDIGRAPTLAATEHGRVTTVEVEAPAPAAPRASAGRWLAWGSAAVGLAIGVWLALGGPVTRHEPPARRSASDPLPVTMAQTSILRAEPPTARAPIAPAPSAPLAPSTTTFAAQVPVLPEPLRPLPVTAPPSGAAPAPRPPGPAENARSEISAPGPAPAPPQPPPVTTGGAAVPPAPPAGATGAPRVPEPPAASLPPLDVDAAKVGVAGVSTTNGLPASSVRSALGHGGFTRCYRDALRAAGAALGGTATLRLAIDDTGHVTSASAGGMGFLPGARACVEAAARALRVPNVDTGEATAEVTLSFNPR